MRKTENNLTGILIFADINLEQTGSLWLIYVDYRNKLKG